MQFLNGWKTYIVGLGAILTAVGAYLNGAMDLATLIQTVFGAIGAMTIRHGISSESKKDK